MFVSDALVIIPTYNELANIEAIIDSVFALNAGFHVLVVDDNSPDGTAEVVKKLQLKYSDALFILNRTEKSGLGTAYIAGFKYALDKNYDFIFEMDADFSHNPADLVRLYAACKSEGADLAIGSRYATGVNVVNWPMMRVLMSFFASKYVSFITGMPVHDATAGFKCYRSEVLRIIDLDRIRFVGYAFQIEMKFLTWKHGFVLKEVPIIFTDRTRGESKMSTRIFNEAFFGVLKMKIRSFFRKFPKRPERIQA